MFQLLLLRPLLSHQKRRLQHHHCRWKHRLPQAFPLILLEARLLGLIRCLGPRTQKQTPAKNFRQSQILLREKESPVLPLHRLRLFLYQLLLLTLRELTHRLIVLLMRKGQLLFLSHLRHPGMGTSQHLQRRRVVAVQELRRCRHPERAVLLIHLLPGWACPHLQALHRGFAQQLP